MFNGIIEELGEVISTELSRESGRELTLKSAWSATLNIGDSVAVNGVCTTVTHIEEAGFRVFVSKETLAITQLPTLQQGSRVNLERSLIYGSRISGHIIYGHVDKTLHLTALEKGESSWLFTFALEPHDRGSVIPKGSIAINGISLTIYNLTKESLTVMIIPHTYHHTNLSFLKTGDRVNCEFDALGKFLKQHAENYLSGVRNHQSPDNNE